MASSRFPLRRSIISQGKISSLIACDDLEEKAGASLLLQALLGVAAERTLLVSFGKLADFGDKAYRDALTSTPTSRKQPPRYNQLRRQPEAQRWCPAMPKLLGRRRTGGYVLKVSTRPPSSRGPEGLNLVGRGGKQFQ